MQPTSQQWCAIAELLQRLAAKGGEILGFHPENSRSWVSTWGQANALSQMREAYYRTSKGRE